MTTPPICIACGEPVAAGNAVIVGLDIADFPLRIPENVIAHKGCEDRARAFVAQALEAQREVA